MYSKTQLQKYIEERMFQLDLNYHKLSKELGITQSNLSRSIFSESNHFTMSQFSELVRILELTPEQVYHILTGKKKKEATLQRIHSAVMKIVNEEAKQP
jgi:DNA-binding Xre family transcriptional regulator